MFNDILTYEARTTDGIEYDYHVKTRSGLEYQFVSGEQVMHLLNELVYEQNISDDNLRGQADIWEDRCDVLLDALQKYEDI